MNTIDKGHSWIPFYMELADKLLQFQNNRKALVDKLYTLEDKYIGYIKANDIGLVSDIDPFTVFGTFNRGMSDKNRTKLCEKFKEIFNIKSDVPNTFAGIPVLNNMKAIFYWKDNVLTDVQPLWALFISAMTNNSSKIEAIFDKVCKQHGIKWNITMALYWIRPYDYISLDSFNQKYLQHLGIDVFKGNIDSKQYFSLLAKVKQKIKNGEIEEKSIPEISYNAWIADKPLSSSENHLQTSQYQEYIDLLNENHNLVLTGAPGTGKTYMAHAIAKEMGCSKEEVCFVQFHPSYDYTDFVEGLRPIEKEDGQMGFERKDGVFKEFCKKAAKNLLDSQKSLEVLNKEFSWEEKIQQFIEDAVENHRIFNLSAGNEFTIEQIKERTIIVHNEENIKTTQINVNADEILELLTNDVPLNIVKDVRNYFHRKFGTQADSYTFILTKAIREIKTKVNTQIVNKVERKPYIFIIDEINRGEASKIFGELFYAIDPGYRGKKEVRVKTQYQNLVPETDIFANGFYVPENIYILATMNDIDRSVESMDFAMRRRFTWKEVTPNHTQYMLDILAHADKAKEVMGKLNEVISNTDGLGSAYQIGPSYFLKLNKTNGDFNKLWEMNIEPLLKEYLRGFRKAGEIMNELKTAYFGTSSTMDKESTDEN